MVSKISYANEGANIMYLVKPIAYEDFHLLHPVYFDSIVPILRVTKQYCPFFMKVHFSKVWETKWEKEVCLLFKNCISINIT